MELAAVAEAANRLLIAGQVAENARQRGLAAKEPGHQGGLPVEACTCRNCKKRRAAEAMLNAIVVQAGTEVDAVETMPDEMNFKTPTRQRKIKAAPSGARGRWKGQHT